MIIIYLDSIWCLNETVDQVRSQDFLMNEAVISSRRHISRENKTEDLELPLLEFKDAAIATENFSDSNKLGQGGFGIVYKVKKDWKLNSESTIEQDFVV